MSDDNVLGVAVPPRPGNHPVEKKAQGRPADPLESPHLKETDGEPVWIKCRASPDCGNYAVPMFGGEFGLNEGGGKYIRYKCLTCGRPFHIRC